MTPVLSLFRRHFLTLAHGLSLSHARTPYFPFSLPPWRYLSLYVYLLYCILHYTYITSGHMFSPIYVSMRTSILYYVHIIMYTVRVYHYDAIHARTSRILQHTFTILRTRCYHIACLRFYTLYSDNTRIFFFFFKPLAMYNGVSEPVHSLFKKKKREKKVRII